MILPYIQYVKTNVFTQLNFMKMQMKTKNLMVFSLVFMSLFLVATVSAATTNLADITSVEVNDVVVSGYKAVTVDAGDSIYVEVSFTSLVNASNVKIEAEIDGDKINVDDLLTGITVEEDQPYKKTLRLDIPTELKDELSDDLELNIKIWNGDYKTELDEITLRVQRPSYNVDVMSISSASVVEAGDRLAVDVVLKNTGYNDLDDVYVVVSIPALNLARESYFGDIDSIETESEDDDDDDADTVRGRFYLDVPYSAEAGIYALEVEVTGDDVADSAAKQIVIQNNLPNTVIATTTAKTVAKNEDAVYELLIVNPTSSLKVYTLTATGSSDLVSASAESGAIVVPAGSTRTALVTASAISEGVYSVNAQLVAADGVVENVNLGLTVDGNKSVATSPVVVLTIVLAIIFVVLLVVLIVLLGRKPAKEDDFGESYY